MAPFEPATWSLWTWTLYAFGVGYIGLFVAEYYRFQALEQRALEGGPEDVERFNQAIRGFPHSGFAKMLGKHRLQGDGPSDAGAR